ncbi:omega-scoloptoxin(05)-Ssm1a-like [Anneissia japonica]|uniref:omega-scoloptoxin(05)-Ssm1a-like n=1 Tax=Anneissia japonica TaxID=1529436 RepID=UPI0014256500|nr:omega-scoloptoxin(05)-Ssm1a-like [Anneissia japonica]
MKAQIRTLIVILAISASGAFLCYDCSYPTTDNCKNSEIESSSGLTTNCSTYCKKEEGYLLGTLVSLTRSCSSTCTESDACEDNANTGTCTYCCKSDECNASSHVTGTIFVTVISWCAAFVFQIK